MTRVLTLHGTGFQLGDIAVASNEQDNIWVELVTTYVSSTTLTANIEDALLTRTVWVAVRRPSVVTGSSDDPATPGVSLSDSQITAAAMIPTSTVLVDRLTVTQELNSGTRWKNQADSTDGPDMVFSVSGTLDINHITLTENTGGDSNSSRTWCGTLAPNPGAVKSSGQLIIRARWSFDNASRLRQTLMGVVAADGRQSLTSLQSLGRNAVSFGWEEITTVPLLDADTVVSALVAGPDRLYPGEFIEVGYIAYRVELAL